MTAVQQGSDESGEGLTEGEFEALDEEFGDVFTVKWQRAIERILADRLAAVQAERALAGEFTADDRDHWRDRAESAEAALATARREADELRDRLAAVEALIERDEVRNRDPFDDAWVMTTDLRAALANPSAEGGANV